MGDWGNGVFQDDHALDIAADLQDACDRDGFVVTFLEGFLARTVRGYDFSDVSEDWHVVRQVLAVSEVVRMSRSKSGTFKVPTSLLKLFGSDGYKASDRAVDLARRSCAALVASEWIQREDREFRDETILTVARGLEQLDK